MTSFVQVKPGVTNEYPILTLQALDAAGNVIAGNLDIPSMQDITVNASNDLYTWQQLNYGGKLQVATTSTNSVDTTIVVEEATFFGSNAAGTSASQLGVLGLSTGKTKCKFFITNFGTKDITGECYISGLAPTVSADAPVWTTPITLAVVGDYQIA